ncbi:MAG: homoserine kinase [Sediminibacterium sp.]|nr:homoserine kinase [Sediminibacterium sp.]
MPKPVITVQVPATVANVVCAFDVMGLCLEEPFDELSLELSDKKEIIIEHLDDFNLPTDPNQNICGVVLKALMNQYHDNIGFRLKIKKNIMPGSGLGSSAASAAGVAVAANYLLNHYFNKEQLLEFALEGEALASGTKHADNIAPIIYGGICLITQQSPLEIIKVNYPELYVAIIHPQIEIKTMDARKILKQSISLKTAVNQWGKIAGLVVGLEQKNYDIIRKNLIDYVIEPQRSILIPGLTEFKSQAINIGALGGGISGSGPAIFMLCESKKIASNVAQLGKNYFSTFGITCLTYTSSINPMGVKFLK